MPRGAHASSPGTRKQPSTSNARSSRGRRVSRPARWEAATSSASSRDRARHRALAGSGDEVDRDVAESRARRGCRRRPPGGWRRSSVDWVGRAETRSSCSSAARWRAARLPPGSPARPGRRGRPAPPERRGRRRTAAAAGDRLVDGQDPRACAPRYGAAGRRARPRGPRRRRCRPSRCWARRRRSCRRTSRTGPRAAGSSRGDSKRRSKSGSQCAPRALRGPAGPHGPRAEPWTVSTRKSFQAGR